MHFYTNCYISIKFKSSIIKRGLGNGQKSKSLIRSLTTTNMYIARARCESQMAVGSSGLNARWSLGRAVEFKFLAWSLIAQSVCQRAFSLLKIRFQRPLVQIMHSAQEDNSSPFDLKIACLCQSIEINNNRHIQWGRVTNVIPDTPSP